MDEEVEKAEAPAVPVEAPPEPQPETAPESVVQAESPPESVLEEPPASAYDSFGWDDWDGSVDALPEEGRGWAKRVADRLNERITKFEEEAEDVQSLRELYQKMINTNTDPRVEELEAQAAARKAERTKLDSELAEARSALEQEQAKYKAAQEQYAEERYNEFKSKHDWIFDGGEKESLALELFQEGWVPEEIPVLMKFKPKNMKAARDHLKKNPAASKEILAIYGDKPAPITDNADLVSGATEAQISSPVVQRQDNRNLSRREQAEAIAAKHMKRQTSRATRSR